MTDNDFESKVEAQLNKVHDMLTAKNKAYGNSALEPVRVFSKANNVEQIRVRIDDKLSRLAKGDPTMVHEDTILDLQGYLVLLQIAIEEQAKPEHPLADVVGRIGTYAKGGYARGGLVAGAGPVISYNDPNDYTRKAH